MVDPQIQEFTRTFLAPFLGAAFFVGIIVLLIERKINDYSWGKRYERRKKIKKRIDENFYKK